ncbi:hypothetical protein SKUN_00301 [Spiroplasma kunkelii CR2-3x]|uniref:Uncharacterized protein n=1 Tax=Spiroplasma kunkelii CR2-3x TaxID=273035 RepID=A0A0K2JF60_SPIKU|nr:hypothetical protein SKUN_00301 [Spiroplasma kunkelii CR2-3x]
MFITSTPAVWLIINGTNTVEPNIAKICCNAKIDHCKKFFGQSCGPNNNLILFSIKVVYYFSIIFYPSFLKLHKKLVCKLLITSKLHY